MEQIAFTDHADYAPFAIDNRDRADAAFGHQFGGVLHRCTLADSYHVTRHHIRCSHLDTSVPISAAMRTPIIGRCIAPDQSGRSSSRVVDRQQPHFRLGQLRGDAVHA
jgi:hypothetical protein